MKKYKNNHDVKINNVIQFPVKEAQQFEILFIIAGSDHSIPLPNITIGKKYTSD